GDAGRRHPRADPRPARPRAGADVRSGRTGGAVDLRQRRAPVGGGLLPPLQPRPEPARQSYFRGTRKSPVRTASRVRIIRTSAVSFAVVITTASPIGVSGRSVSSRSR